MGCGWAAPPERLLSSWQLLQAFEDIPLGSILQQIQEKYDLQKVKKVRVSGPGEVSGPRAGEHLGPSHQCLESSSRGW